MRSFQRTLNSDCSVLGNTNAAFLLLTSVFLGKIKEAFDRDTELQNLLLDTFFTNAVQDCQV